MDCARVNRGPASADADETPAADLRRAFSFWSGDEAGIVTDLSERQRLAAPSGYFAEIMSLTSTRGYPGVARRASVLHLLTAFATDNYGCTLPFYSEGSDHFHYIVIIAVESCPSMRWGFSFLQFDRPFTMACGANYLS
jgi:hypothetical protein